MDNKDNITNTLYKFIKNKNTCLLKKNKFLCSKLKNNCKGIKEYKKIIRKRDDYLFFINGEINSVQIENNTFNIVFPIEKSIVKIFTDIPYHQTVVIGNILDFKKIAEAKNSSDIENIVDINNIDEPIKTFFKDYDEIITIAEIKPKTTITLFNNDDTYHNISELISIEKNQNNVILKFKKNFNLPENNYVRASLTISGITNHEGLPELNNKFIYYLDPTL